MCWYSAAHITSNSDEENHSVFSCLQQSIFFPLFLCTFSPPPRDSGAERNLFSYLRISSFSACLWRTAPFSNCLAISVSPRCLIWVKRSMRSFSRKCKNQRWGSGCLYRSTFSSRWSFSSILYLSNLPVLVAGGEPHTVWLVKSINMQKTNAACCTCFPTWGW